MITETMCDSCKNVSMPPVKLGSFTQIKNVLFALHCKHKTAIFLSAQVYGCFGSWCPPIHAGDATAEWTGWQM